METIIAIVLGPIIAVIITLWHQNRKEKSQHKFQVFRDLMSHGLYHPVTERWVDALNSIDVVFYNKPKVVKLWHEYYDILHQTNPDLGIQKNKYLDLLQAMALSLGYKTLKQTDIDRCYFPVGLGAQKNLNEALQQEQLKYLQNSNKLYAAQIPEIS